MRHCRAARLSRSCCSAIRIVDNRPAILLPEVLAEVAPDGYTVLVGAAAHAGSNG